jgi:hypothetical protein
LAHQARAHDARPNLSQVAADFDGKTRGYPEAEAPRMCEQDGDRRRCAPATLRKCDFILNVLRDVLPTTGVILEVASGSGQHLDDRFHETAQSLS